MTDDDDDMEALLGAEIRQRRIAARLSQQRLAARLGVDQGLISKIENGVKRPSTALVQAIDEALAAGGCLVTMRVEAAEAAPAPAGQRDLSGEEMVLMAARRAREFALAHQGALSEDAMEQIRDDVRSLAIAYPQRPLPTILGPLTEAQEAIFTLLENRQRPQQARELYALAGVTTGLLAKASHDLASPRTAMTHARTAFLCADNADHDALRSWIRGLQSLIAYWDHRPNDALRYAQLGATHLSPRSGTVAVWLPASEARAWAALGNAAETRNAVDRAERARDDLQDDDLDTMGGICFFSVARQLYYAADALSWLPDETQAAERYGAAAVDAYHDPTRPEWAFGDQAGSHAGLAHTRVARAELDGAAEAIGPVLDLPPDRRINGVIHSVQRVHAALVRSTLAEDPAARDLSERIEMFARTPAAALGR
ncbi:helix-turn-helix transcriptional regulator [Frankia sp. CNm7]|uniref:Helix-turn-helix transcriptional regulator n=1 Tax=Frankia nepalensis TaxID=1836974 RepID=A0A937UMB5_9ACTN|nr:helix-turn-helix transcriptional regulator [Frankia nepalensis]MBL7497187.1 helix-turn-helix transcriptional regulator [Frankia nepalensis]MBL7515085.1 helix-turn-helix transcriptional regulator [Frankia nepalensis]MBL7522290.1 helix-turn-helix transcriptional regulator [Frankia nepalensis]MBL7626893.1 helix-turn-helix transcriptional regulator [Frankia nepalensis]